LCINLHILNSPSQTAIYFHDTSAEEARCEGCNYHLHSACTKTQPKKWRWFHSTVQVTGRARIHLCLFQSYTISNMYEFSL